MNTIPFILPDCLIDTAYWAADVLVIEAHSVATQAVCRTCGQVSTRRHSVYQRHPADTACCGKSVRLCLTVQRFFCDNADCAYRTFAERLPDLLVPSARRTNRLVQTLREIAFAAGGEAGTRLSRELGIYASSSTLLRLIRATLLPISPPATVVGIDDWAKRRGHSYGTILVDLESRYPIDLLPDREPETVATWFRNHPDVKVVTRDRGQNYRGVATLRLRVGVERQR